MNERDRILGQWPKRHVHAAGYHSPGLVELTPSQWAELPVAYSHIDAYATHEARHCPCGSTLVVMTQIHNVEEE